MKRNKFKHSDALVNQFYSAFRVFNEKIFENKIKPFSIFFDPQQKIPFKYDDGDLLIGADIVSISIKALPLSFLHELIHIFNKQSEIVDVAGHYHNKKFLKAALDAGLYVIKTKAQGWAVTSLIYPRNVIHKDCIHRPDKNKLERRITAFSHLEINSSIFKDACKEIKAYISDKSTKTFFLKYECNCPAPHNSIRSGRRPDGKNALNIICQVCNSKFHCVTSLRID